MVSQRGSARVWTVVGVACLGILGLGVVTSQGWRPDDTVSFGPPYTAPTVARSIATTNDLERALDTRLILIEEGPPETQLYLSGGTIARETRESLHAGAWERSWESADRKTQINLRATQYRYAQTVENATRTCAPTEKRLRTTPGTTAGVDEAFRGTVEACVQVFDGGTQVDVSILFVDVTSADQVTDRLERTVAAVETAVEPSLTRPRPERIATPQSRTVLLRSQMVGLLVFSALVTLPSLLRDRATWERLQSHLVRRRVPASHVDVEPQVRAVARRVWAIGAGRLALVVWCLRLGEELRWRGSAMLAAVLLALVLSVVTERRLLTPVVRRHRARAVGGGGVVVLVVGALLTIGVLGGVVALWNFYSTMIGGWTVPGMPDWQVTRWSTAVALVASALLLAAPVPLAVARSVIARARLRTARNDVGHQGKPHVLLLRSFVDDQLRMRSRRLDRASVIDQLALRQWERFEEIVAAVMSKYAPVLAVATPGEVLPPGLGAARIQLSHEEWKDRVQELTAHAPFVVMTLGRTASLVWEIERLRDLGFLHKTLFVVPPVRGRERARRLRVLSATLGIPWDLLMPRPGAPVLAVCLPLASSRPTVVVGRSSDDLSYDLALEHCIDQLTRVDGAEARAELEPAVASSLAVPAAEAEIIPVGMARKHRSWVSAIWALNFFVQIGLIQSAFPYLSGDLPGQQDRRATVPFSDDVQITRLAALEGNRVIVLLGSVDVAEADFESGEIRTIGQLPAGAMDTAVNGEMLYYVSSGAGVAGAFDLVTGRSTWTRTLDKGVRSVLVLGNRLYVASPAENQIIALDKADGGNPARIAVGGAAWDLAPGPTGPAAVLADTDELVLIDESMTVRERIPVLRAPTQVTAWGGTLAILSAVEHRVVLADGTTVAWFPSSTAEIASFGDVLAVEGYERVSVFTTDGRIERWLTESTAPHGLVVNNKGRVAVATSLGVVHRLTP